MHEHSHFLSSFHQYDIQVDQYGKPRLPYGVPALQEHSMHDWHNLTSLPGQEKPPISGVSLKQDATINGAVILRLGCLRNKYFCAHYHSTKLVNGFVLDRAILDTNTRLNHQ